MSCLKIKGRRTDPADRIPDQSPALFPLGGMKRERCRSAVCGPGPSARQAGFTLVEVMIALAIIGVTAVVLLQQRLEIVRAAARARDLRTAWVLTSQKVAELELDPTLWTGAGRQSNGDFYEVDPEYGA